MLTTILLADAGVLCAIYAGAKLLNMQKGVRNWRSHCHGCCEPLTRDAMECPYCHTPCAE
jgi:rRNA maturation endonuclease Nob1